MILWLAGFSGVGKSTLADLIAERTHCVWLDADDMRKLWPELGYSKEDRIKSCHNMAKEAKKLEQAGHSVIVSAIAPYKKLREKLSGKYGIMFMCLDHKGAKRRKDDEQFEDPDNLTFTLKV